MAVHFVVDGSNIATEGRTHPSIHQLREAVAALAAAHPAAKISVVVDATFGHRIDPAEVAEFDAAVAANELVAPPAGAIGRGDAFVLSIADKVNGSILSNDSYQEFHGQYPWLFDEGRLVGGKPVPHVGWVFVNRLPVRGPLSRKSVSEAKRRGGRNTGPTVANAGNGSVRVGSAEASKPMPVPKAPPPGAALKKAAPAPAKKAKGGTKRAAATDVAASTKGRNASPAPEPTASESRGARHEPLNDQMAFLSFVGEHPVGSSVTAIVDHYSSHGAYVRIGDVRGYVPLRLMGTPAPRSARDAMKIGETVQLRVHQYLAAKRSIDLEVVADESVSPKSAAASPAKKAARGRRSSAPAVDTTTTTPAKRASAAPARAAKAPAGRTTAATTAARKSSASTTAAATSGTSKAAGSKRSGSKVAASSTSGRKTAASKTSGSKTGAPKTGGSKASAATTAAGKVFAKSAASRKATPPTAAATKAAGRTAPATKTTTNAAGKKSPSARSTTSATTPAKRPATAPAKKPATAPSKKPATTTAKKARSTSTSSAGTRRSAR